MERKIKLNILVLCTGNSCRSQMAEGFLRNYFGANATIYSAGIYASGVNPNAIKVMKEIGIDISNHTSNKVDEYFNINFDFIITVCDNAKETCPYFPSNAKKIHHNFPDPFYAIGAEEDILKSFRFTRDLILEFCKDFFEKNKGTN